MYFVEIDTYVKHEGEVFVRTETIYEEGSVDIKWTCNGSCAKLTKEKQDEMEKRFKRCKKWVEVKR